MVTGPRMTPCHHCEAYSSAGEEEEEEEEAEEKVRGRGGRGLGAGTRPRHRSSAALETLYRASRLCHRRVTVATAGR